jgi:Fe-S cluster assembly iron-binding protein IscA
MLTVTESAKELLKEVLVDNSNDPEIALRLKFEPPSEFGVVLGREEEGDQVIEHEETKVLLVAPELAQQVEGVTLDVQGTGEGAQLVMHKE